MRALSFAFPCARLLGICAAALAITCAATAQPTNEAADLLRQLVDDYVKAWNAGDVEALGRLWAADGELINARGVSVDRQALLTVKSSKSDEARSTLSVKLGATRLLEPNVALVDGESSLATSQGTVLERTQFSGILVKKDGVWRIRLIRELSAHELPPEEPLKDLAWMVGEWVAMGDSIRMHISSQWDMGQRYLVSQMEVEPKNGDTYQATQRLGWDPATRSIKSWYFDSRGSIGASTWQKSGDHWLVTLGGTQFDGESMSGTSTITPVDADSYLRTLTNARVGAEAVPDQELHVLRVTPQPAE